MKITLYLSSLLLLAALAPAASPQEQSIAKPQTLARWPNEGFVKAASVAEPGNISTGKPSVMSYAEDRPARWTTAKDAWLFGYFRFLWADATLPIASIDPAQRPSPPPWPMISKAAWMPNRASFTMRSIC